jgi:UV DNA damage endonuclease
VPFASHPVCVFNWQEYFRANFMEIGKFIKTNNIRISMHPDQFTLINSPSKEIFERSRRELLYHAQVLDLMELDRNTKIQIHVGGVYNNKKESIKRFKQRYMELPVSVKKRLVIENDDKNYNLADCVEISSDINIPVLFDSFHHLLNNRGELLRQCFRLFIPTWKKIDGLPMIDYSSQKKGAVRGAHAFSININKFKKFLKDTKPFDFDIMLEIKDKEKSAIKAVRAALADKRFIKL